PCDRLRTGFADAARPGEAGPCDRDAVGLPCGHVEDGEAPELAAVREAEEETGLVVTLVAGAAPFVAVDPVGGKLVHTFLATIVGGALRGEVPGEGTPCWTTPAALVAGPYGDYNRRAFDFFGIAY
ncbi:MAG: NUDIX hydrolase, partial [Myxococcales bacterium]|nr:NUDIX hydrolase [Myxococcales bacterium]